MSTPVTQLNSDGTAEVVEPQEFPGYYIVNGVKVDPDGNPWKERATKAKAEPEVEPEVPVVKEPVTKEPAKDPVTGKK